MSDLQTRSEMAKKFKCGKCNSCEGKASIVSFSHEETNILQNDCIGISCKQCGFTEFYDRNTVSGFNIIASIKHFFGLI